MKRIILAACICISVLTGCGKILKELGLGTGSADEEYTREENAVKLTTETVYYNDFLGISYSLPKSWWLYEANEENVSESPGDITSDASMAVSYQEFQSYDFQYVGLLSFGNLKESTNDSHLGFEVFADYVEGAGSIAAFMQYFEKYMLEPTEEAEYELTGSDQVTINGKSFEVRDYIVDRKGDDGDYKIITLTCPVKEGYFLNIIVDYWPQNTRAQQIIIDSLGQGLKFY
ncbi:MAG: hypothetical protein LBP60_08130 [Spirochaetaceae bacterium]|jgi:hypothetical protein|nr:hypothetical protein [Spirochaetaceae bacterium]